jgi:hypothetical protein
VLTNHSLVSRLPGNEGICVIQYDSFLISIPAGIAIVIHIPVAASITPTAANSRNQQGRGKDQQEEFLQCHGEHLEVLDWVISFDLKKLPRQGNDVP